MFEVMMSTAKTMTDRIERRLRRIDAKTGGGAAAHRRNPKF
jgi:hypothetical protein